MFELFTATCSGFLAGWISRAWMESRIKTLRTSGHYGNCQDFPPAPPRPGYRRVYFNSPTQVAECGGPCEAGPEHCNCGALWRDEPIRLDPGSVQRGNGNGGPSTPKPDIIPRGTRSITFPDPTPDRQPTNPFTGEPVQSNQPPTYP